MRLFDTGHCQIDGASLLYTVTEYADEVLAGILPERALTPDEAKEMLGPVLDALGYLHGKGLVHGHLKPSNILVVDNELKLSADGLFAAGKMDHASTASSVYDAPELATCAISPAADLWSLGVTLVESLSQHPPLRRSPAQPELVVPESIPEPLAGIARACLELDPARRCTLADVQARLAPAQPVAAAPSRQQPVAEMADNTRGAAPARWRGPVLIVALLVLAALVTVLQMRSHKSQPSAPTASQQPPPTPAAAPPSEQAAVAAPPQASVPQAPAPRVEAAKGATQKGAVAEQVQPEVLPSAMDSIQGTVVVVTGVSVDQGGNVSDATLESAGPSKYFARVALEAAHQWNFKPAQVNGQASASEWTLRFEFRQSGIDVTPTEVAP
jgi:TonB family protein